MQNLEYDEIERMKRESAHEVKAILDELEHDYPGVTEGMATILSSSAGAAGSLATLYGLGVTGLSAAGITSGLVVAGSVIGGGITYDKVY